MIKLNIKKEKVLNGDEQTIYYSSFTLNIGDKIIQIEGKDFFDNPLSLLKFKIEDRHFIDITKDFEFKNSIVEKYIDKEDGLEIYYFLYENVIVLLSFGELNPNHFVVNLVGIWQN